MHHRALEAEPGYGAFELVGRRLRIGGRQHRKTGEPVGMGAYRLREPIVGAARQPHGEFRVEPLHRRRAMRQHLHVDAGGVHLGDPALADVVEAGRDIGLPRDIGAGDMGLHLGVQVMLFEGYNLWSCRHLFLPRYHPGPRQSARLYQR